MELIDKLSILSGAAKYDVACTSSGVDRNAGGGIGSTRSYGICHSFTPDGRCVSLLKVLLSNACIYDCAYCVNRRSNDIRRAAFKPEELAELTIGFYRRNYIEGLFLSSAVIRDPDYTCEQMIRTLRLLREEYCFRGYIHAKIIPGTDERLISILGMLADRVSVNLELPSNQSLKLLAPDKSKETILKPMGAVTNKIAENRSDIVKYRSAVKFAPAGQSTQMIVGASPESDYQILTLAENLYGRYKLKRVFFSAYIPMVEGKNLPALDTKPPLLREHRLYQADWLLRYYGFKARELLDEENCNFNVYVDPKCSWALSHLDFFPVEINNASREMLLRIPGVGVRSVQRILTARRTRSLDYEDLKKLGVVLKRAIYFITCKGRYIAGLRMDHDRILNALLSKKTLDAFMGQGMEQLSLFDTSREDVLKCITGQI